MYKDELQRMYDEAGTLSNLAERLGVAQQTAKARLIRWGIPIRDMRGTANTRRAAGAPGVTPEACADWQRQYDEAGSVRELARRIGKSSETTGYHLRKHGVKVNRAGFKSPRTVEIAKGAAHHNWKGGTTMHPDGYILELAPEHPAAATQKGYVLQHRLVMEKQLGRYLTPNELVHHKNEDKTDNRPENLELMSRSHHMSHHKEDFPRDANGRFSY